MNRYRVLLPLIVNGEHGQGDEFDHELTPAAEADALDSGLLEIVPRRYRVIGDSRVFEVSKNDEDPTFMAALRIEQEAHLIDGGHVERVEEKPPAKKKAKGAKK